MRAIIMKLKWTSVIISAAMVTTALSTAQSSAPKRNDEQLLQVRETVWRAWFAGDTKTLEGLVPPESVVMSGGEDNWKSQADVFRGAAEFHANGGKLVRLEFPRTEVQHFGEVAIVWSLYLAETETNGKRSIDSGRVTEIFVRRYGQWTNPGWHTDAGK
jgi:hypothetical protein